MKHFLFDLDGLLIDSEPLQLLSFEILAKKNGIDLDKSFVNEYMGRSAKENLSKIFKKYDDKNLENLEQEKEEILFELIDNKGIQLRPGALKLLELLKYELKCQSLNIVSSSSLPYIELVLKKLKLSKFFNTITSGDEVENNKPYPDIYLLAAQKLHTKPEFCVVFEDTVTGAKAAKTAMMKVILIPSQRIDIDILKEYSDKICKSLNEVNENQLKI
jgi:HAD superfamily hydrolase (TIGR01509 family)